MQLVVPSAVRNAVSAATTTFTMYDDYAHFTVPM